MAGKRKNKAQKFKTSLHQLTFDLRHFVYECFVYSALKFQVPETCICKLKDCRGYDKRISKVSSVVFRSIFKHQIALRSTLYEMFKPLSESDDIQSFKNVKVLLEEATKMSTAIENLPVIDEVEISIAVACELIIFLYSKNANLYLNEIVKFWFKCFRPRKKLLDKHGVVGIMYALSAIEGVEGKISFELYVPDSAEEFDIIRGLNQPLDNLIDEFILDKCVPYQAKLEEPKEFLSLFLELGKIRQVNMNTFSIETICFEREQVRQNKDSRVPNSSRTSTPVPIFRQYQVDSLRNTGLGIIPHEELLQIQGLGASASADATASQTQVAPGKHYRESSGRQRRARTKFSLPSRVEDCEGLTLDSSGTKQSSKEKPRVSVDNGATSSRTTVPVPVSKQHQDFEVDALENTGLGIIPHEELLQVQGLGASASDATRSPTLIGPGKQSRRPSGRQRRARTTNPIRP